MAATGTPAAMEITSFLGSIAGAICIRSLPIACGFTERSTTSASRAAATLSRVVRTP
jgi:hypothetical protein